MKRLSRRNFLTLLAAALGTGGIGGTLGVAFGRERRRGQAIGTAASHRRRPRPSTTTTPTTSPPTTTEPQPATPGGPAARWSDPATWPTGVPGASTVAVVSKPVLLDVDAHVAGVVIEGAGQLVFDPAASRTLESSGNVVVRGRLAMRPGSAALHHQLTFQGVDEARFAGGGMDVLTSDVGLWVVDAGVLDLQGAPRRAWTRVTGAVEAGATRLSLVDDPAGWRAGDELVVTPTLAPDSERSFTAYDTAAVQAVSGRTVTLDAATRSAHPSVDMGADAGSGRVLTAEVLNLTRNVRIEGTPGHRAHIFIRSSRPQSVRNVAIRHMGPRQKGDGYTELVLGRYGLHFHMADDGVRGSRVEGVVIRDTGSHAFVAHQVNGVSFRDCISHDTFEDAFWWDGAPDTRTPGPPSNDILYERCVASKVQYDPPFRGYTLAGFVLGRGSGGAARDCVAVGVQGSVNAAGFEWPEGSEGIWAFQRCVAHNNANNGIFVWQNTSKVHTIANFTGYHNRGAGISHGAYVNPYLYKDSTLYGNRGSAIELHANSQSEGGAGLQFVNLSVDGAGQSDYLVKAVKHVGDNGPRPVVFSRCSFRGARKAAFGWVYEGDNGPSSDELVDILDCGFSGNEFWLAPRIQPGSRINVKDAAHGSIVLRRADQPGTFQPKWNARVR
jgi:G8 domain